MIYCKIKKHQSVYFNFSVVYDILKHAGGYKYGNG